jgi:hypothetical protein
MSELKYCQGSKCHEYKTKDRIKGIKGSKYYGTRRRSNFWYGNGNFCSMNCYNDWFATHGEQAINHFGRVTEPKKVMCDQAWYKDRSWRDDTFYLANDLLGQRIPITQSQYNDKNIITPNNLSP